jgi:MFS family permease
VGFSLGGDVGFGLGSICGAVVFLNKFEGRVRRLINWRSLLEVSRAGLVCGFGNHDAHTSSLFARFAPPSFSIGTRNLDNSGSWRIVIALGLVFCLILGVGIFFVPESPRWLIERGREEEARRAMARVRGLHVDHPLVNSDFDEQWAAHELDKRAGSGSWAQCFVGEGKDVHNKAPYRTMIMVVMMAFQQLTGANVSGEEGEGVKQVRRFTDGVCLSP